MFALGVAICMACPDVPPIDATRFGYSYEMAKANWLTAEHHLAKIVPISHPAIGHRQRRTAFRWCLLVYALSPKEPMTQRLINLKYLRESIGEDDFNAGLMPTPLPEIITK